MAVLVMRPGDKGNRLTEMLNKSGIAALHLPFFEITAGRELNDLPLKMNQLKAGDYVVAVSQNAVDYAAETFQHAGFRWRNDLRYFAVGQQTAAYFAGLSEQAVAYPFRQETSEGLLNLTPMQQLKNRQVLLLRGNGGRDLLPTQVAARGGAIEVIECYQRRPLQYDNIEQTSIWKRAGIRTLLVTSAEILNTLIDFVPPEEHDWLRGCRLITVSSRIEKLARKFGWTDVTVAAKADNNTLLQTILTLTS
ncbi:uroporphyrinogen-III synthase [Pasteurellaceae bacterium LIM206]|nr:uroporphyrinogen-III synthase [Pasteurellaceae bacterium LIM206]